MTSSPRLGFAIERQGPFIYRADAGCAGEALAKLHKYRHDFLRRPHLEAVEKKAKSALSVENVNRKQRAVLGWHEQFNELPKRVVVGITSSSARRS